jgi:RimJ/RimL family protein N-acetyltransferase
MGGIMKLKNGQNIVIRKAGKKDAQILLDYLNVVGGESDNLLFGANEFDITVEQEEGFIESFKDSKTSVLLAGFIDDKVVCIGSLMTPSRERISHHGDVAMSVLKEYWGLGIGSLLMAALIEFAKSSGKLENLHLGVKEDNSRAIKLYEKMGFHEIGRYPKFFKINGKYYDEILMNLYL